jgi:hypothetical protein
MVIGERFAWGHLQKTAGDATLGMFQLFPDLILHADPRNVEDKHTSFASRADQLDGKLLVSNMRRLPTWTLSWAHHRARYATRPDGGPVAMNSPQQMVDNARADKRLSYLIDSGRYQVDRWLRMEELAADFSEFISEFTDLTGSDRERIATFDPVNALSYDHEIGHWFTPEQIMKMYENNPLWASVEERVYGDLLLLD